MEIYHFSMFEDKEMDFLKENNGKQHFKEEIPT